MSEDVIDYAMPLIKIERLSKEIHDLCLEHKYDPARDKTADLIGEARVLQAVLKLMQKGIR